MIIGQPWGSLSSTSAVLPCENVASAAAAKQLPSGNACDGMEWYSSDSNQPPRTAPDGHRIDMVDPADLVDIT